MNGECEIKRFQYNLRNCLGYYVLRETAIALSVGLFFYKHGHDAENNIAERRCLHYHAIIS